MASESSNQHSDQLTKRHPNRYRNADANGNSEQHAVFDDIADGNSHRPCDADANEYPDSDWGPDADSYVDGNTDPDFNSDSHECPVRDPNRHTDTHRDAN